MAVMLRITSRSSIFFTLSSSLSTLKRPICTFPNAHLRSSLFPLNPNPKPLISLNPNKPFLSKLYFSINIRSSPSDSESSDSDSDTEESSRKAAVSTKKFDKSKLPPPYDPFNKKPVIEEPEDPTNLQEIFHKIRSGDGLFNFAVKMFDGLSKDGLTHEALQLFSQIKDKGNMPDVVAHTAVIEAYANAGQAKEALKTYTRMLACGTTPNAYTYGVVIKGLAGSGDKKLMKEMKKIVVEMMEKGMKVNAGTCVSVFEGFVKMGNVEEGKEFLEVMKGKGFVVNEKEVREVLKGKRGPEFRSVMDILFGK